MLKLTQDFSPLIGGVQAQNSAFSNPKHAFWAPPRCSPPAAVSARDKRQRFSWLRDKRSLLWLVFVLSGCLYRRERSTSIDLPPLSGSRNMQPSPYIARGRSQTFSIYNLVMLSPPDIYALFLPLLLPHFPPLAVKFPEPDSALANHTEQIGPLEQQVSRSLLTRMFIPQKSLSPPGVTTSFPPLCCRVRSHLLPSRP